MLAWESDESLNANSNTYFHSTEMDMLYSMRLFFFFLLQEIGVTKYPRCLKEESWGFSTRHGGEITEKKHQSAR